MEPTRVATGPVPPEPTVSADGRFYLDGERWVPLPFTSADLDAAGDRTSATLLGLVRGYLGATVVLPFVLIAALVTAYSVVPDAAAPVVCTVVLVLVLAGYAWLIWPRGERADR